MCSCFSCCPSSNSSKNLMFTSHVPLPERPSGRAAAAQPTAAPPKVLSCPLAEGFLLSERDFAVPPGAHSQVCARRNSSRKLLKHRDWKQSPPLSYLSFSLIDLLAGPLTKSPVCTRKASQGSPTLQPRHILLGTGCGARGCLPVLLA